MKELVEIQARLKAPKNNEAKGSNGRVLYKYRSCEDILESAKELLKELKCTITIADEVELVANRIYIKATATITNEGGESVSTSAFAREPESLSTMNPSQVTGAASSYARKYALNGLFAIDDTRDADVTATQEQSPKGDADTTNTQVESPKGITNTQEQSPKGDADTTNTQVESPKGITNTQEQSPKVDADLEKAFAEMKAATTLEQLKAIHTKYASVTNLSHLVAALSMRRKELGV